MSAGAERAALPRAVSAFTLFLSLDVVAEKTKVESASGMLLFEFDLLELDLQLRDGERSPADLSESTALLP